MKRAADAILDNFSHPDHTSTFFCGREQLIINLVGYEVSPKAEGYTLDSKGILMSLVMAELNCAEAGHKYLRSTEKGTRASGRWTVQEVASS